MTPIRTDRLVLPLMTHAEVDTYVAYRSDPARPRQHPRPFYDQFGFVDTGGIVDEHESARAAHRRLSVAASRCVGSTPW